MSKFFLGTNYLLFEIEKKECLICRKGNIPIFRIQKTNLCQACIIHAFKRYAINNQEKGAKV